MLETHVIFFVLMAIGVFLSWLLYWYWGIDRSMLAVFRKLLQHEFYEPFKYTKSIQEKLKIMNALKDEADNASKGGRLDFPREHKIASREILAMMRYDLKMIRCEAKAQAIIERMR